MQSFLLVFICSYDMHMLMKTWSFTLIKVNLNTSLNYCGQVFFCEISLKSLSHLKSESSQLFESKFSLKSQFLMQKYV